MEDRLRRLPDPTVLLEEAFFERPLKNHAHVGRDSIAVIGFFGLHVVLAGLIRVTPTAGTVHALLTFAIAVWALLRWSNVEIACVAAYVAGAEVLWRMTMRIYRGKSPSMLSSFSVWAAFFGWADRRA